MKRRLDQDGIGDADETGLLDLFGRLGPMLARGQRNFIDAGIAPRHRQSQARHKFPPTHLPFRRHGVLLKNPTADRPSTVALGSS